MKSFTSMLAAIWRLSIPYFRSEEGRTGLILLGAVVAIELSIVALQVILNQWYNRFYNTLQDRNWDAFVSAVVFFCVLAAIYTVLAVYQLYLNQWLQIRWRRWMTQTYLREWLEGGNHYRMQLLGDAADNPDQRIADDLQMFVQYTLTISIGLLNAVVTLFSFVVILWTLSAQAPLTLFGAAYNIPGYLVWAALLYAVIGTVLTHLIGWRLIPLNFQQQRFEADFRFNLVRSRENAEQIAALRGETAEREEHLHRFSFVVANWLALMQRPEAAHLFHPELFAGFRDLSLHGGEPGVFLRRHAARRPDADGVRLQQRAGRPLLLHHRLPSDRRVERGHHASDRFPGGNGKRPRHRG